MKEATSESGFEKRETDLAADLRTRGSAICNHVIKAARDFFAQWQYVLSSDEQARESFALELGFCPRHAWQLHSMSSPWGESIGLAVMTESLSRLLAKTECDEAASSSGKMDSSFGLALLDLDRRIHFRG